ncbi:MAG: hypothetical protein QNJ97_16355 [Myxococcota bacterium]|nr:hypothetical protein [Myxococcota bacterium]
MALANRQDQIRQANGELIGLFFFDVVLEQILEAKETSEMMDTFGWRGGWRIEDTNLDIFDSHGDGGGVQTRFLRRFPIVYVIETATMRVVAGEKGDEYNVPDDGGQPLQLDVIAEMQAINQK